MVHDVVEDYDVTIEQLRGDGFSQAVLDGILSVTKRPGESYSAFVERAGANRIGRGVKLADRADNSDLARLASPTERDLARMDKYRAAIAQLRSMPKFAALVGRSLTVRVRPDDGRRSAL